MTSTCHMKHTHNDKRPHLLQISVGKRVTRGTKSEKMEPVATFKGQKMKINIFKYCRESINVYSVRQREI